VFNAIDATGESVSCSAEAAGCRAYTGNAANNIEQVSYDSFEDAGEDIFSGWRSMGASNSLTISTESTQVGMHSLRVPAGTSGDQISKEFEMGTINYLDQYQVSFWAKGNPQNLKLYFRQAGVSVGEFNYDLSSSETVYSPVSADWREYTLGPVYFRGDTYSTTTPVSLVIERTASGSGDPGDYYLDHIRLLHINGSVNLIADSWKTSDGYDVPVTCDQYPYDALPGTALGCAAYTNQAGEPVTVTGFERLCRMEAVGCQALYETKNTYANSEGDGLEADKVAYNVECRLNPTQFPAGQKHNLSFCSVTLDNTTYSCSLQNNITSCFIDEPIVINSPLEIVPNNGGLLTDGGAGFTIESFGSWYWLKELPASLYISPSTVVIAEDSGPIFLAGRSEYSCAESEVGCTRAALEHRILPGAGAGAMEYVETYIKNNPTNYKDTLCVERQSGCEAFTYSKNIQYFKDPQLTGGALCDYRAQSDESGKAGWYLRGVGQCSNSASAYCNSDDDCPTGGVCGTVGEVPCYSNYILPNGELGIWSNNTTQYENKVGVCEAEANGCTELIDPVDTADYPSGRPYYVIDNKKLQSRVTECGGKVSQKEGCVLFNQTEQPKLSYDAAASYKLSDAKLGEDDKLVSPVSTDANSANLILKVDRERECGEWLSCRGSMPVFDARTGKTKYACYDLQLCQQGTNEFCTKSAENSNEFMSTFLTYEQYIKRNVSWSNGREFSGYSIYDQYSPAALKLISPENKTKNVGDDLSVNKNKYYLGFVNNEAQDQCSGPASESNETECGIGGMCWNNECVQLPESVGVEEALTSSSLFGKYLIPPECRGYPSEDSPFPISIVSSDKDWFYNDYVWSPKSFAPGFDSANVCFRGEKTSVENCDCSYNKVEFTGGEKPRYYAYASDSNISGVCSGQVANGEDAFVGKPCDKDADCNPPVEEGETATTANTCVFKNKETKLLGWKGFCLEYDDSRSINGYGFKENETKSYPDQPCLTWYPLDYLPINEVDVYFNDVNTGYVAPGGKRSTQYCAEASPSSDLSYISAVKNLDFSENTNTEGYDWYNQQINGCKSESPLDGYSDNDGCVAACNYQFPQGQDVNKNVACQTACNACYPGDGNTFVSTCGLVEDLPAGKAIEGAKLECTVYDSSNNLISISSKAFTDLRLYNYHNSENGGDEGYTYNTEADCPYSNDCPLDGGPEMVCLDNSSVGKLKRDFVCNVPATGKNFPNKDFCRKTYYNKIFKQVVVGGGEIPVASSYLFTNARVNNNPDSPSLNYNELDPFKLSMGYVGYKDKSVNSGGKNYSSFSECAYERAEHFGFDYSYFSKMAFSYFSNLGFDFGGDPVSWDSYSSTEGTAPNSFQATEMAGDIYPNGYITRFDTSYGLSVEDSGWVLSDKFNCAGDMKYFNVANPVYYDKAARLCHLKFMSRLMSAYAYDGADYQVSLFPGSRYARYGYSAIPTSNDDNNSVSYLSEPVDNLDSGIIVHKPNKFEAQIDLSMFDGVTLVFVDEEYVKKDDTPEWSTGSQSAPVDSKVLEHASSDSKPAHKRLVLDFGGFSADSLVSDEVQFRQDSSNCEYCKYITKKYEDDSSGAKEVVYQWQWWQKDPSSIPVIDNKSILEINPLVLSEELDNAENPKFTGCSKLVASNWFAVELRFDKATGVFKGYRSRQCDAGDQRARALSTAVVWNVSPMCKKAVVVFDKGNTEKKYTNKAWTDRVWGSTQIKRKYFDGNIMEFVEKVSPFGSGQVTGAGFQDSRKDPWYFGEYKDGVEWAGFPFACSINTQASWFSGKCMYGPLNYGGQDSPDVGIPSLLGANGVKTSGVIDPSEKWNDETSLGNSTQANRLSQLFAHPLSVWDYEFDSSVGEMKWNKETSSTGSYDVSFKEGKPPVIFPAISCKGETCNSEQYSIKRQLKNKFAINDVFGDGAEEKLFGWDSYYAVMRFYAWADHNQMPIKRIKVNWNNNVFQAKDQTGLTDDSVRAGLQDGYFPNFKPGCDGDTQNVRFECKIGIWETGLSCEGEEDTESCGAYPGSICAPVSPKFGNRPESCVPQPVIRQFNYTCENLDVPEGGTAVDNNSFNVTPVGILQARLMNYFGLSADAAKEWYNYLRNVRNLENSDYVCVYQPKVQVLDNWGWCTGSCKTTGSGGCYNGDIGENVKQCEESGDPSMIYGKEWVRFQNVIIVAPNRK